MSAQDNLSPVQFYHGTRKSFVPGAELIPGHEGGVSGSAMDHVYATTSKDDAATYAYAAPDRPDAEDNEPKVYEVAPTGKMEDDSADGGPGAWRTAAPLHVVRRV